MQLRSKHDKVLGESVGWADKQNPTSAVNVLHEISTNLKELSRRHSVLFHLQNYLQVEGSQEVLVY